ncbi:MAG TPA: hypothetical protein VLA58_11595, partial [Chitinophagaceae bacterium]|nr:hypothetical protein [Chitinophagaceae bacterium]
NQSTKVSFISLDSNINTSFKVHPNYPINVNWAIVEPVHDSVYVIQKYLFGCPTDKKFSSTDYVEETMKLENTLVEVWRGKVIELKPFTGLVGYPRR